MAVVGNRYNVLVEVLIPLYELDEAVNALAIKSEKYTHL